MAGARYVMTSNVNLLHHKSFEELEASLKQQLDDYILQNKKILWIKVFRDHVGCSVHEALDALAYRCNQLREEKPNEFLQDHDDYWKHFYS